MAKTQPVFLIESLRSKGRIYARKKKRRDKSRILMTDGLNPASLIGMAQKPAVIARSGLCQGPSASLGSSLQAGASYPLEEEEERDMKRDRKWGTEKRKSRERCIGKGWQSVTKTAL